MSNARSSQSKQYVSVPIYPVSSGSGSDSDSEEDLFVAGEKGRKVVSKKTLNDLLKKVPETVVVKKDSDGKPRSSRLRRKCCRTSTPCCILLAAVIVIFVIGLFVSAFLLPGCEQGSSWSDCLKHVPTVIKQALDSNGDSALGLPAEWRKIFRGAVSSEANLCPFDQDLFLVFGVRYFSPKIDDDDSSTVDEHVSSSPLKMSTNLSDLTDTIDFSAEESSARSFGLESALVGISLVKGEEVWRRQPKQPSIPINQVGCVPGGDVCFVTAFPGYLELFSAKNGDSLWMDTWAEAKLTATFVTDVNSDSKHDLFVLSYVEDGRSRSMNGQTSLYIVSGADGKVIGRPLKIPGCLRLADPHVTDQKLMDQLHVTCFDDAKDEHLLRLSVADLLKSAVNGTADTIVGHAEKSSERVDLDGNDQIDEEETDTGGVVHKGNLDLRWVNWNNGTADISIEGVAETGHSSEPVRLWGRRMENSLVAGGGFVGHCQVGESCSSMLVKTWSEQAARRRKREVFVRPVATVKPPLYRMLEEPADGIDGSPEFDLGTGQSGIIYEDLKNAVEEEDMLGELPMIDVPANPPRTGSLASDRGKKHHSKPAKLKTTATSQPPKPGFIVRVQPHENVWEFHEMQERVAMLRNVVGSGKAAKYEETEVWREDVELACYTAAEANNGIFPVLGNCVPRPHRHSLVSEAVFLASDRQSEKKSSASTQAELDQVVVLVSTTPTLERVQNGDSRRHRLVTVVNHRRYPAT